MTRRGVGTPKAGVFSERQASVVADQLIARHRQAGPASTYDGKGICYIEFGHDRVARVEVTFLSGQRPDGQFDEPSALLLADKAEFGTSAYGAGSAATGPATEPARRGGSDGCSQQTDTPPPTRRAS